MDTVKATLRQTELREETELEFPRVYQGQAYTVHVVTSPASNDGDSETTTAVLTRVGSQEEENMNAIADINDEAISKGEEPELDFSVVGGILIPDHYKLSQKGDPRYELYNDALAKLSIDDEEERYADSYIFASSVEERFPDGVYSFTFNAGCCSIFIEDCEAGVSPRTGKAYDAFTSYKISTLGATPDDRLSLGTYEARLPRGQVSEDVAAVRESMNSGDYLRGCTASGSLRFREKQIEGEDSPLLVPVYYLKQLFIGTVGSKKSNGGAPPTSAPVSKKPMTDAQKSARQRMEALKAKAKTKAPKYDSNGEDF